VVLHDYLKRYSRLVAHLIYQARGDLLPEKQRKFCGAARQQRPSDGGWITACFDGVPMPALQKAILDRRRRHDALNYATAQYVVQRYLETGKNPSF
jgi:hypothetical protein